jgi:hypothetical protein
LSIFFPPIQCPDFFDPVNGDGLQKTGYINLIPRNAFFAKLRVNPSEQLENSLHGSRRGPNMSELLGKFEAGELITLAAVVGGALVAIIAFVSHQWGKVRVAEMDTALKQQMLEKGMSAAEIEQVMKVTKAPTETKVGLAQMMIEHGYEGEDIERVVKAYNERSGLPDEKPAEEAHL